MLTKELVIDKIEILEDCSLQVRRATYILEDGVRIAGPMYHRAAYTPGDSVDHEDEKVQRAATTFWTADVIAAAEARKREAEGVQAER